MLTGRRVSLLGMEELQLLTSPGRSIDFPELRRWSGWRDLPLRLRSTGIYATLGWSMLPKTATRWGWGHLTQRTPSEPRITLDKNTS